MIFAVFEYIFTFLFGLCIGSFLNVVIYRIEAGKNLGGRSVCLHCNHQLSWKDLFPVFSYFFLRGKCRYCSKKISIQYPLVELATGMFFVFVAGLQPTVFIGFSSIHLANLIFSFYIVAVLIVLFVYDLKHYLLPDTILIPAIIVSFLWILSRHLILATSFWTYILAAVIASGFFFLIWLVSKGRWMGFGDVKLAFLMGIFLGLQNVLVALFLSFFLGAIIGITMMLLKKGSLKSEVPFGPFLVTGTFIALFFGKSIITWYLNLF